MSDSGNDILDDLAARVARLARQVLGVPDDAARQLGQQLATEISRDWGGTSPYIPCTAHLSERDRLIFAEFDGRNFLALARKYRLSERRVRTIIARGRRSEQSDFPSE